jgi:phosphorylcholine metabolism protein LicD
MKYNPQDLARLHEYLYQILGEIVRVCEKHSIPYFIQGGSAIGAFYNQGIVPWDDDIDVGMLRDDYERFLQVAPAELGDKYFLEWFGSEPNTPFYFAKVKMKGYGFQIEMKYTAWKFGLKIKEVSIIFRDRTLGTSKMSSGILGEAFWGVLGLRFRRF